MTIVRTANSLRGAHFRREGQRRTKMTGQKEANEVRYTSHCGHDTWQHAVIRKFVTLYYAV